MKQTNNNIRIKDIAERAGVSPGTVDRVIHGRGEVSAETRKKVQEILEELQFSPNLMASTLASARERYVSVLIPSANKDNPYWADHLKGVRRAKVELSPYGLKLDIHTFSISDTREFRDKSEQALLKNPEGILIAPVFYRESVHFLGKCRKRGIPFAFIDTPVEHFEYLSFIGQNSCQSGAVAAKLLSLGNPPDGRYIIFNIAHEKDQLYHLSDREKGFRMFFENKGGTPEIIRTDIHHNETAAIREVLEPFRKQHGQLCGIFVTGSKVHLVARALEDLKMTGVRLVGYDLISENKEYLRRDVIDFLISQQPEEQGYLGVTTLFNSLFLRKEVPALQAMPIDIVTRENLDQYPKCH